MTDKFLPSRSSSNTKTKAAVTLWGWQETLSDQQEHKSFLFHQIRWRSLAERPKGDLNIKNPGPFCSGVASSAQPWCNDSQRHLLKRTRYVSDKTLKSTFDHSYWGLAPARGMISHTVGEHWKTNIPQTSNQDGGVGRHALPPCTTIRRITISLNT